MMKAGRVPKGGKAGFFYNVLVSYAFQEKNLELFDQAVEAWTPLIPEDQRERFKQAMDSRRERLK